MALSNNSELEAAVATRLSRQDLSSLVPDFVRMAEVWVERRLMKNGGVRQMESVTTDTMSSSTITLPSDWLGFRDIYISGTPRQSLELVSPDFINIDDTGNTQKPTGYAIMGTKVYFSPSSDSDYTVGYTYLQSIPAIASNSTNWLLTAYPDLYLYGALMEASTHLKNDKRIPIWKGLRDEALQTLIDADRVAKHSGPMRTRAV